MLLTYLKGEEEGSRLKRCIFPNSDDANPPIHIPELRVTTAEFDCTHLFVIFSPSFMMACVRTVLLQYSAVSSREHTRYGSQFVSSPSPALLSALSKECRVLFYSNHSILCVYVYIYVYFFSPSFFFFLFFLFVGPVVRIKRTCED